MNVVKLYKEDKIMEYALNAFRQFEQAFPAWKSEIAGDAILSPLVNQLQLQITTICKALEATRKMVSEALERMVEVDVAEVEKERQE